MKDLKTVLLLGIPLLAVVAGLLYFNRGDSASDARDTEASAGRSTVAKSTGPVIETGKAQYGVPTGTVPSRTRGEPGTNPDPYAILTPELLRELLAKMDSDRKDASYFEIEKLLKYGGVEDPMAIQALLVKEMKDGGNRALLTKNLLLLLKDEDARKAAAKDLMALSWDMKDLQAWQCAFEAIGEIGDGAVVQDLARLIRAEEDDNRAWAAVRALGMVGTPEAATELAAMLAQRAGTPFATKIEKAIGLVKSPEMVSALGRLMSPQSTPELRSAAVRAMGLTGSPEAVSHLKSFFERESDVSMKQAAILALGRVGGKLGAEELIRIHKEGGDYSQAAGIALHLVGGEDAVEPLLEALDGEESAQVKVSIIKGLGNTGSPKAIPKIREMLRSPTESQSVRARAASELARLQDHESVGAIIDVLKASEPQDRNLQLHVVDALSTMARKQEARRELRDRGIPVLDKIIQNTPQSNPVYFHAMQAKQLIIRAARDIPPDSSSEKKDEKPPK